MQDISVAENYKKIKSEIPRDVLLVAVSKTKTVDEIAQAISCGCRDFGENKAQELCSKYEAFPDVNWHFIGRLQKNKVRKIVGKVCLIHSVDSYDLAEEINKRAQILGITQNILIQVNVANEVQKGGVSLDEVSTLIDRIKKDFSNVNVVGLMQTAPQTDNAEDDRIYFRQLNELFEEKNLEILSMGMSGDYKVAIEEGANCVRIGSAIFGEREYKL